MGAVESIFKGVGKLAGGLLSSVSGGQQQVAAPAPPPPPPPPPTVTQAADRTAAAASNVRQDRTNAEEQARKRGRRSTVLTGPEGVGSTPLGVKTLVGS
jgi:hypothetical protein